MKLLSTAVVLASTAALSHAFSVNPSHSRTSIALNEATAEVSELVTTLPNTETIYDRLGVSKENIAIGIDAEEFMEWIGTREQVIRRFMDEINFDRERAEQEADKFFMDSELVNAYITYEKNKDKIDPSLLEEQNFRDPKTIATYAAWIIGGAGFSYVRRFVVEPKFESGEWEPLHIDLSWLPGASG